MYQSIFVGIFLGICTYTDLKTHTVSRWLCILFLLLAAAARGYEADSIRAYIMGLFLSGLPGAGCLLISFFTGEALGYGDSLVILVCGLALGLERTVGLVLAGFFLAAVFSAGLCVICRADRKREIPFLPFLAAAFLVI